jgi:hypothetical protein
MIVILKSEFFFNPHIQIRKEGLHSMIVNKDASKITSLNDLQTSSDSSLRPYNTLIGYNLGNAGVIASMPMHRFYSISAVANQAGLEDIGMENEQISQRNLDRSHAFKLAVYMIRGLIQALVSEYENKNQLVPNCLVMIHKELGKQPYFALQPIVVNIRTCKPGGVGIKIEQTTPGYVTIYLSDSDIFWVIDGQHRRYAMDLVFEFLETVLRNHSYPKRGANLYRPSNDKPMDQEELHVWQQIYELSKTRCTVLLDIHLGLHPDQERQLFHDLNNLGKKIEASLAFQFDDSNPVNLFIKEELIEKKLLTCSVIDKDVIDWHKDQGSIPRKDLIAVNARLLLNKTTVSGAKPQDIADKIEIAKEFWEAVDNIHHFGQPGAKKLTVAAQPVVLKGLAKLIYDFAFGREKNIDYYNRLIEGISTIDFSHQNPMWRYYELAIPEREKFGLKSLAEYLPSDDKGFNRDIGGWDNIEGVMRFGAKSNDIFPIIGDMIRWKLNLPKRSKRGESDE